MKILFIACYTNNSHFIDFTKKSLDKYLINSTYDFICLNDAPSSNEENYLKICDIITGEDNCYDRILNKSNENNFIHIKIPQNIHIKNRPNHGGPRHIENLNWFNQNIDTLYPTYKEYDFICHIDSDAFFCKKVNLDVELKGYDMAGPFIYLKDNYYIHTGLFFINLKTVKNMKDISWNNTMGTDTGSDILNFIKNNPQYKIKKLGHYNGYSRNKWIKNNHTIKELDIPDNMLVDNLNYKLIDSWFDHSVVHFREGSCFGVGSKQHRNKNKVFEDRLSMYNTKMHHFRKLFK